MDLGLSGKTALVLGGSSGLGFAVGKSLAAEGAHVYLASRSEDRLKEAVSQITSAQSDAKVDFVLMDMADPQSIHKAVEELGKKGAIDILVNNTGGPAAGDVSTISLEQWDMGYQQLVRGVLQLAELTIPIMQKNSWGRILNITSTSAKEYIPKLGVSGVFRAGLRSWVKSAAKESSKHGILINNLLPGPTNTERLRDLEKKSPEFFNSFKSEMAIGRIPEAEEVGRVAAFLCSPANSVITGTDILADGGYTKAL